MIVTFSESTFIDQMSDKKIVISVLGWKMHGIMFTHSLAELHTSPFKLLLHSTSEEIPPNIERGSQYNKPFHPVSQYLVECIGTALSE